MKEMCEIVKLYWARLMQRSIAILHLGPSTSLVSSEQDVSCDRRPDQTRRLAQRVDVMPEPIIRMALMSRPPVTKARGMIRIKMTQQPLTSATQTSKGESSLSYALAASSSVPLIDIDFVLTGFTPVILSRSKYLRPLLPGVFSE